MPEDTKLAALIVRNIGDIEAAYRFACGELSDRLVDEIKAVCAAASESWDIDNDAQEGIVNLSTSGWQNSSESSAQFWLSLGEEAHEVNEREDEISHSWIAVAVASDPFPSRLSLWFEFKYGNPITPAKFGKLIRRESELVNKLKKQKFEAHHSGNFLLRPILIDREALARAFEDDDFDLALEPVRAAVIAATAAMDDLDALVGLVRAEAKHAPPAAV